MRQLRLASSGCQVYPLQTKHCVAINDEIFCFASTLVVYVYSTRTFRLEKLLSDYENSKTITSLCISHFDTNLLAVATADGKVSLWNINTERICSRVHYKPGVSVHLTVSWSPSDPDACILAACETGAIKILQWEFKQQQQQQTPSPGAATAAELVSIKVKDDVKVTATAWSSGGESSKPPTFALGCSNGIVFLHKPSDKSHKVLLVKDRNCAVCDVQWDRLSSSVYLLVAYSSFISLWDADAAVELHVFDKQPGGGVTSIAFVDWQPGNFLSCNSKSGVLKLWNVSQKTSLSVIKISSEGGLLAAKVDAASKNVLCANSNGSVYVYSLQHMHEKLCTSPGHTETIFDCKFNPTTPDVFASASYDGNLKLWRSTDFALIRTLQGACDIVYSCDWSPCGTLLLGGCSLGKIMVWSSETGQELGFIKHHSKACYCVSWNKSHLSTVCSTSGDGHCVVFELDIDAITSAAAANVATGSKTRRLPGQAYSTRDPNASASVSDKPLPSVVCLNYAGKCPMFGAAWCPHIFNILCTGSQDGIVRVFDYTRSEPLLRILTGHSTRAFHCLWSPLIAGVLASGGDDKKVLVWQLDLEDLQSEDGYLSGSKRTAPPPRSVLPTRELLGHTSNVRALSWNYEHKQLLLSGSWDSTIRLWDISSGLCLYVIAHHVADVYSITSHPDRPFTYVSCSRDSTIRQWELDDVFPLLRIQAVFDQSFGSIIDAGHEFGDIPPAGEGTFPLNPWLSGRKSRALASSALKQKASGAVDTIDLAKRYYLLFNFFSGANGCVDLWECALELLHAQSKCRGPVEVGYLLRPSSFRLVTMEEDVVSNALSDARKLESKKMAASSIGGGTTLSSSLSKKLEDELRQAALAYARAGDLEKHCMLLAEIGDWGGALSAAPGVSLEFWKSLSLRHSESLAAQGSEDCVALFVALGAEERAAQFYLDRKQNKQALILARAKKEKHRSRALPTAAYGEGERTGSGETKGVEKALIRTVIDATAASLILSSTPVLAAAQYLSSGLVSEAIQVLQASGELDLAYALALCFGKPTDLLLAQLAEAAAEKGSVGAALSSRMSVPSAPSEPLPPTDTLTSFIRSGK